MLSSPPLVVIVDDDDAVRFALATRVELDGYRVIACDCAESALQLHLPETRACLIVDDRLPGMSGLKMLARLRSHGCHLPAAMITSQPTRRQRTAAAAADAQVLEKPLLGDVLTAWIRGAVPLC